METPSITEAYQSKNMIFFAQCINKLFIKRVITVVGCGVLLCGCSIYEASNAPPSIDYKKVHVDVSRAETISILGLPKLTDNKENQKTDTFEFLDGIHGASKARIILYLAGDLFTAGLSELIFWPIELNAFDGKQCRATVGYNANDRVISYDILDSDGTHLWTSRTKSVAYNTNTPAMKQAPAPIYQNTPVAQPQVIQQPIVQPVTQTVAEDTMPSYEQNYQQPQVHTSGKDLRGCLALVDNTLIAKCVRGSK